MAGLLGDGFEDPRSSAVMALAGGLLKGDFGGGLLGANNAFAEAKQNAAKKQYMDMQMQNMQSEIEARKLKTVQDQRHQQMIEGFFPGLMGGQPAAPGQPAPGQPAQGVPPNPAAMGGPGAPGAGPGAPAGPAGGIPPTLAPNTPGGNAVMGLSQRLGIPPEAIQSDLVFNQGKGIAKMLADRSAPNWQNVNGNMVNTNAPGFQGGFQPGVNVSNDGKATMWQPDGQGGLVVGAPKGALDTYAAYQNVGEGTKARYDPVQVATPDGATRFVPRSQVVAPQGGPQGAPPGAPQRPQMAGPADADRFAILTQELQKAQAAGNAGDVAALQAEIGRLSPAARTMPSPSGLAVAGGYQATPTTAQRLSAEAGGKINESWIKSSYEPTLQAGQASRDLLDTVQVTRQAMENLGKTGWGTQTQAAGAAVLNGLGIAPQNAKLFAANAEVFQSKAMERLWTTLNEAKGPQTEGDADRASKTFASLKNTPQANAFILDMAEAKAQRDQVKARFYQEAQPIARQKGDLSEVDREWARRAPSIFNMPTMKRWAGGLK